MDLTLAEPRANLEKAAKILLALGPETAGAILNHLDAETMERLAGEIARIPAISKSEKQQLLRDFEDEIRSNKDSLLGGKKQAENFLIGALGSEKAGSYLRNLEKKEPPADFSVFSHYPPLAVATVLRDELPQTTALVLSCLQPAFGAKVLQQLPREILAEVAKKMVRMTKISPEMVKILRDSLLKKLKEVKIEETTGNDGAARLTEILAHMDLSSEENILSQLQEDNPDLARKIRENLVTFEDLFRLTQQEVRKIFEQISDNSIWACALKGAGRDYQRFLFSCLSVNRASDIRDEMQNLGSVRMSQIEENRLRIMSVAEALDRQGDIILRKQKEKYVE